MTTARTTATKTKKDIDQEEWKALRCTSNKLSTEFLLETPLSMSHTQQMPITKSQKLHYPITTPPEWSIFFTIYGNVFANSDSNS